jgi:dihydrofolate reductase
MAEISLFEILSLDGVMQAPARPDEDPRDGFARGGWAAPYASEEQGRAAGEGMATTGALLFGRRTYEDFYSVWPHRGDNPFTEVLNNTPKYVVSRTLAEPLPWQHSTLLADLDGVRRLKAELDRDIVVLGSGELAASLIREGLVDAYTLLIHPLVLGGGRTLFGAHPVGLRLESAVPTSTGVIMATYRPA